MKRKWLVIGISTISVILLILTSLSNVVGYQTVQTSQQNLIKERINQRDLLFQTIVDIANNKEIQRIILKSHMSKGVFPPSEITVITKNQIKQMYLIGLILSKVISKSKIQSLIGQYQFNNQRIQQEICAVIEKDSRLNEGLNELSTLNCDCQEDSTTLWKYPIICFILSIIYATGVFFQIVIFYMFFPDLLPKVREFITRITNIAISLYYLFICDEVN